MTSHLELEQLRAQMDAINHRLTDILHERARLARRIGSCKRDLLLPAIDAEREQSMTRELLRTTPPDGFSTEALTDILDTVFAASRAIVVSQHA